MEQEIFNELKKNSPQWRALDKNGMVLSGFVQTDNSLIRAIIAELDPMAAIVYLIILSHRNTRTNECYPTKDLLTRELHSTMKTVRSTIRKLEDKGFLHTAQSTGHQANHYFFPYEPFYDPEQDESLVHTQNSSSQKAQSQNRSTIGKKQTSSIPELPKDPDPPTPEELEARNKIKRAQQISIMNDIEDSENEDGDEFEF